MILKSPIIRLKIYILLLFTFYQFCEIQSQDLKKPSGFKKYSFSTDGNFTRGNVNRNLIAIRSDIQFIDSIFDFEIHPRFIYGQLNDKLLEREYQWNSSAHLFHFNKFYIFFLANAEQSNLRGIESRWLAGGGPGFRFLRTPTNELSVTTGLIQERTEFFNGRIISTLRNSSRLQGKHILFNRKLHIQHQTFYIPSLTYKGNVRWNTTVKISMPVSGFFSITTIFEDSYESVVEPGKKNTDLRWTFGIVIGKS